MLTKPTIAPSNRGDSEKYMRFIKAGHLKIKLSEIQDDGDH